MAGKTLLFILLSTLLAACASATHNSFNVSSANFSTAKSEDLCEVYGYRWNRFLEARAELTRRHIFNEQEWAYIDAREVVPGMSTDAVIAAWPLGNVVKNRVYKDVNGKLIEKDMVFSCNETPGINIPAQYCPYTDVKIRAGKVVAVVEQSKP